SAVRIYLVNNPSHLEAVNPVVQGVARARQDLSGKGEERSLPVQLHGDAAFAGQGIVAETLNMSRLDGYRTGGTVHLVINNQIGYTTTPEDARSTRYSTDVAKMLLAPVFHVHGEDPEAAVHAAELALAYRNEFHKDVVIDLICYRRYGHNEGDEPYFTQPTMYERIRQRPSLDRVYEDALIEEGVIDKEAVKEMEKSIRGRLNAAYDEVHDSSCSFPLDRFFENWESFHGRFPHEPVKTGVERSRLVSLARKLNSTPGDFSIHPKLGRLLKKRMDAVEKGAGLDWANAEALAFASLLTEGLQVRLSGQDVGRGTFSHRHAALFDVKTGAKHVPLDHLGEGSARFQVYNSLLAEAGVLGFEYGYAMTDPGCLTLWEAQFGDFANGAQNIIDLFIASGESKWRRLNGLALLLPHGWEGLGPEHSSARLERFLQLCAEDNMQVCNLTTPAQYFHLLRRQMTAGFRKPLVLMTPKSLLRHPKAVSSLSDLETGVFQPVIDDPAGTGEGGRVLFCSGKIYYQLLQAREEKSRGDVAIIRVEQFYPFPGAQLKEAAEQRAGAREWFWVQEEPENMGAWGFVRPRLEEIIGTPLVYVGREPSSSPATGFPRIYKQQQAEISGRAFAEGL
ncbi:MAG: 2-oxoglutarate dehydrogenase E1 component, partial [Desulfobacterales bacterium]|nr:2-oxoglutarate dehydrogenase E1 component [Desulfobacterales bacterium]